MKRPVSLFFFFLFLTIILWGQGQIPQIVNSGEGTIYYCGQPVVVFPDILIQNIDIENPSDGFKISIANYNREEDALHYQGSKFSAKWAKRGIRSVCVGTGIFRFFGKVS